MERCYYRKATIVGTQGVDHLVGSRGRDVIVALGGDDVITKLNDEDLVCAGDGDDTVRSARGLGSADLGSGDDRLLVPGAWMIEGGRGDDRIVVDHGPTRLHGGPGDDYLRALREAPHAQAVNTPCVSYRRSQRPVRVDLDRGRARGEGRDRLVNIRCVTGSHYDDVVVGGPRPDAIETLAGFDLVHAGAGDDSVNGGLHADRIYLGDGNDYGQGDFGWDRLYGQAGNDSLEGWFGGDYLDGGTGDDQLFAGLFCSIGGNTYDTGGLMDASGNELFGGPGDDYLTGDRGNDRVDGGPGYDQGQGGYHDGRADWLACMENVIDGCLPDHQL